VNVSDLVALPFRWGSSVRGKRFFHPLGVVAAGSLQRIAPDGEGLPIPTSDVVARFSKATGTPGGLPDLMGLALRVDTGAGPWDILLVSAGSGVLSRVAALRPVTSWSGHDMTTLMPLSYGGTKWWLRARIDTGIDGAGLALDDVRRRIRNGGVEVALDQASGGSAFRELGRLTLTRVVELSSGQDVSFDPVLNTAPGVKLYPGWLADLRASAYARSRDGREAHGAVSGG